MTNSQLNLLRAIAMWISVSSNRRNCWKQEVEKWGSAVEAEIQDRTDQDSVADANEDFEQSRSL